MRRSVERRRGAGVLLRRQAPRRAAGRAAWSARADAVDAATRHPLARALRLDKLSLAALEATLRLYRDPTPARDPRPRDADRGRRDAARARRAPRRRPRRGRRVDRQGRRRRAAAARAPRARPSRIAGDPERSPPRCAPRPAGGGPHPGRPPPPRPPHARRRRDRAPCARRFAKPTATTVASAALPATDAQSTRASAGRSAAAAPHEGLLTGRACAAGAAKARPVRAMASGLRRNVMASLVADRGINATDPAPSR